MEVLILIIRRIIGIIWFESRERLKVREWKETEAMKARARFGWKPTYFSQKDNIIQLTNIQFVRSSQIPITRKTVQLKIIPLMKWSISSSFSCGVRVLLFMDFAMSMNVCPMFPIKAASNGNPMLVQQAVNIPNAIMHRSKRLVKDNWSIFNGSLIFHWAQTNFFSVNQDVILLLKSILW